jgi:hypothetical protein
MDPGYGSPIPSTQATRDSISSVIMLRCVSVPNYLISINVMNFDTDFKPECREWDEQTSRGRWSRPSKGSSRLCEMVQESLLPWM